MAAYERRGQGMNHLLCNYRKLEEGSVQVVAVCT